MSGRLLVGWLNLLLATTLVDHRMTIVKQGYLLALILISALLALGLRLSHLAVVLIRSQFKKLWMPGMPLRLSC